MLELFTLANLFTLVMLVLLQAVLGFDNLLYISIESKRVDEDKQSYVRKLGIGLAIVLRIGLLLVVLLAIEHLQAPFLSFGLQQAESVHAGDVEPAHVEPAHVEPAHVEPAHAESPGISHAKLVPTDNGKIVACQFNIHSVIVLLGGIFIIYTAFKEICHFLAVDDIAHSHRPAKKRSVGVAIFWIVAMNLVFSFDSILSAIALTNNAWVMSVAIIIGGMLMIFLADHVSSFLQKNRMYEVLGLFILLVVGVMLVSEGGHLAHIHFFGHPITPMTKSTFYFVIGIMVLVDLVQSRYQKKLLNQRQWEQENPASGSIHA